MKRKFSIFALTILLLGQTLLGPLATVSAAEVDPNPPVIEEGSAGSTDEKVIPAEGEGVTTPTDENPTVESPEADDENEIPAEDDETTPTTDDSDSTSSQTEEGTDGDEISSELPSSDSVETDESNELNQEEEADELTQSPLAAPISLMSSPPAPFNPFITKVKVFDEQPTNDGTPQGNELEQTPVVLDKNDEVAVIYYWDFKNDAHGYGDGATFEFQLPAIFNTGILPASGLTGNLTGNNVSGPVGTYTISQSGTVTFVFNHELDNKHLDGYFYAWLGFDESQFGDGLEQQIDFSASGLASIIPVTFKNSNKSKLKKEGAAVGGNFNANEIEWIVEFNQGEDSLENIVFTDILGDGLSDVTDVKIEELTVNVNGSISNNVKDVTTDFTIDTSTGLEINFGSIEKAYRITYKTKVSAPIVSPFGSKTYENTASVQGNTPGNSNDYSQSDSKRVQVRFSEPLTKNGASYNANLQEITWKVQYNYNKQTLTSAELKDTLSSAHEYDENSFIIEQMTVESNGSASGTGTKLVSGQDYNVVFDHTANTFTLTFTNPVTVPYEITYKTKSKDRVYTGNSVKNDIDMGNNITASHTQPIRQVIFSKAVDSENFNSKTIDWVIHLNRDKKDMTDIVIDDSYLGNHMKLDSTTVTINGQPISGSTEFELRHKSSDSDYLNGFEIVSKSGVTISDAYVIKYTTSFDPTVGTPSDGSYKNTATLNWKEAGIAQTAITDWDEVQPQSYTTENGNKIGAYNAAEKTITWTVDLNYNLYAIENALFEDTFTGNQTYVADSLEIYELDLDTANNNVALGSLIEKVTDTDTRLRIDSDRKSFELELGNSVLDKKAIRLIYKTTLEGEHPIEGVYSNTAVLTGISKTDGQPLSFNWNSSATPHHGGEYLIKKGSQDGNGSDYATWNVTINPSQSYIVAGTELNDQLSSNHKLLPETIKLFTVNQSTNNSGTITSSGTELDVSKYDIETDDHSIKIKFKENFQETYILTYQSFINAADGEKIENTVTFSGVTQEGTDSNGNTGVQVRFFAAGGGAFGSGSEEFYIKKTDKNGGAPLKDAVFRVLSENGNNVLATLTTDSNGEAKSTSKFRYGKYILKEITAPEGYILESDPIKVIFDKDTDGVSKFFSYIENNGNFVSKTPLVLENEKGNWDFKLTKQDVDTNNPLQGAVFTLQKDDGSGNYSNYNHQGRNQFTSDVNGEILLENLQPGKYKLVETKAPLGYAINAAPNNEVLFEIDEKQKGLKSETITNKKIDDGSVRLTKTDEATGERLQGAVFRLLDANRNVVESRLVTNSSGIITVSPLPGGTYRLQEIQAPAGYKLNSSPITFSITEDRKDVRLNFTNSKDIQGSVELTKVDSVSNSVVLNGAQFTLYNAADDSIVTDNNGKEYIELETDINGKLFVGDLKVGDYYFVETKAPEGYELNATPIPFIIENDETVSNEILLTVKNTKEVPVSPPGGGGGTPPSPTDPEEPNKPGEPEEPNKPGEPEDPDKPVEPENPDEPGEPEGPTTPGQPGDPSTPGGSSGEKPGSNDGNKGDGGSKDKGNQDNSDANKGAGGSKTKGDGQSNVGHAQGEKLPQTGEGYPIGLYATGLFAIAAGLWMVFRRKSVKQ